MLEIFQDLLDYARKYEQGAARIDPTIHSHVFGRPAGMAVFQRMIEIAKQADDIWIGTRSEAVRSAPCSRRCSAGVRSIRAEPQPAPMPSKRPSTVA
jgi:hypothetical protein